MSTRGFVMSVMRGARGKDAAIALILPDMPGTGVSYGEETTATGTPPLALPNALAKNMNSCETNIVPVQDLHGFANPWPAGGGTNLFNPEFYIGLPYNKAVGETCNIGSKVTDATVSGYTYSRSVSAWGQMSMVMDIDPSTDYAVSATVSAPDLAFIEYVLDADGIIKRILNINAGYSPTSPYSYSRTFTSAADEVKLCVYIATRSAGTITVDRPQLEKSASVTSFAPYENICPITGYTSANIWTDPKYGGNIEWNQLESNWNFESSTHWGNAGGGDAVYANNECTITFTTDPSAEYTAALIRRQFTMPEAHKILISLDVYTPHAGQFKYDSNNTLSPNVDVMGSTVQNTWTRVETIATATGRSQGLYMFPLARTNGYSTGDVWKIRNAQIIDLTQMFGAGNEPATVEAFRALFPKPYYPYNSGETMTVSEVNGDPYNEVHVEMPVLGKNLLNINRTTIIDTYAAGGASAQTTPRTLSEDQIWIGMAFNNYFNPNRVDSYSINGNNVSLQINSTAYGIGFPMKCTPGEKYTISHTANSDMFVGVGFYDKDGNFKSDAGRSYANFTATVPEDCVWLMYTLCPGQSSGLVTYTNLQFEHGTSASPYEPYTRTVYGGTLDPVKGKLVVESKGKHASELTWTNNGTFTRCFNGEGFIDRKQQFDADSSCYCDTYKWFTSQIVGNEDYGIALANATSGLIEAKTRIYVRDIRFSDVSEFVASFATNDPLVVCPLATPITYDIDPTQIKLVKGTNYVWSDCGDSITAIYIAKS